MEAQAALDELALLSTQVVEAAIVVDGALGATTTTQQRGVELAAVARELLAAADAAAGEEGDVERVEVTLPEGSVLAVRDGERAIVASTLPDPTPGLVLYDLRTALRRSALPPRGRTSQRPERAGRA